jgi:hydroxyacylglutathione hydrolase
MYFKQFYLGCLAHASYLIGSEGKAVVVDPQRDVDQYIREAAEHGLEIVYVLETHLHADFVSGHRELADRTGAEIVFGKAAGAKFLHRAVSDGDQLRVGTVLFEVMETPGHTPEGVCFLVTDTADAAAQPKLLTGDTLFIGDVGRPDLAGSAGFTAEQMAGSLYNSLRTKIIPLADEVEVYPAHGAGSMCGKNISKDTSSTIGAQKRTNYALQPMSKDAFVEMMTADLPEAPAYFAKDAEINRSGAPALIGSARPEALSADEVKRQSNEGVVILDVRSGSEFGNGHIPGALNIGLSGQFASWAGSLLDLTEPIIVVAEDTDSVDETVMRLARVGIESVRGYLQGGMYAWDKAGFFASSTAQLPADELNDHLADGSIRQLIDVRRPGEFKTGSIPAAHSSELAQLARHLDDFDKSLPTAVMCQSGYRSSAAASLLERAGFEHVYNVVGGMNAWKSFQINQASSVLV